LADERIAHVTTDLRNKNARGTLDAAIRSFKRQLALIQAEEKTRDWASLAPRAVKAYNALSHSGIVKAAPEEVPEDKDLQFLLREQAAKNIQTNESQIRDRGAQIERMGAFRNELPNQGRGFERSFKPRYSGETYSVAKVIGGTVVSGEAGDQTLFPTRHVIPVSDQSRAVSLEELTGNEQTDGIRRAGLMPYKERLVAFVGSGKWIHVVAQEMRNLGMAPLLKNGLNFKISLRLLGFAIDAKGRVTYKKSPAESAAALRAPRRRLRAKTASAAA
jgi:hypothetical protein